LDRFAAEQVSVPVGWWLTPAERDHITQAVLTYMEGGA
jgi:hypothetical protein